MTPMALETKGSVLVVGATSPIARAAAAEFARQGYAVILAARDKDELDRIAADLRIRSRVEVTLLPYDADLKGSGTRLAEIALELEPPLTGAVWVVGDLGDQERAQEDVTHAKAIVRRNFTGVIDVFTPIANAFEARGAGFLIAVGSVAGDRGRAKNYVYGAAKAALHAFMSGMRQRLDRKGVRVRVVKPGFVDTAMTFAMGPLPLLASPDKVGQAVARAATGKKDEIYTPGPWRWIMLIIRHLPERVFKKTNI